MVDQDRTLAPEAEDRAGNKLASKGHVVDLGALNKVAQGNRRFIYMIPPGTPGFEDFDVPLVLKVPRYADREQQMSTPKRVVSKLYPASGERGIRIETNYWKKLARRFQGAPQDMPLPMFHGYVSTTDGTGALWEAMCDAKGNLAPTLRDAVRQGEHKRFIEPLNRFVDFSYANNLLAPDIQLANMVLVERKGQLEVVLIDGYGDARLISFRAMFAKRNRQNLDRRYGKLAGQSKLVFDTKKRAYAFPSDTSC